MSNIKNSSQNMNRPYRLDEEGFPEPMIQGIESIAGSSIAQRPYTPRVRNNDKQKLLQELQNDLKCLREEEMKIEQRRTTLMATEYDVGDLVYLKDGTLGIVSRFYSVYDGSLIVEVSTQYGAEEMLTSDVFLKNSTTDAIYGK